ncbi:MAG: hypothetical protein Q9163_004452 [Psora crenata]
MNYSRRTQAHTDSLPGEIPQRQDIRDLSQKQRYLYLEGLKKFQNVPTDNPLSYFQIAGIHGRPYQTWPKAWPDKKPNTDIKPAKNTKFQGPYLALFESALQSHVKEIARGISSNDPNKKEYTDLAENFRIPYWDWASQKNEIVPQIALDPDYREEGPKSSESVTEKGIKDYNPLFAFRFPEGTPNNIRVGLSGKLNETTVRYPDPQGRKDNILDKIKTFRDEPSGKGRLPVFRPEHNLTERTAWILQAYDTYMAMSNNGLRATPGYKEVVDATNYGSLEDIHNAVHTLVGGGGHMSSVPVSAFDPLFWLHHTNIDRLFAIWQALHQNDSKSETYVLTRPTHRGNFALDADQDEDIDTRLYPFRPNTEHDSWYTSNGVKRTQPFGYSYPETAKLPYPVTENARSDLRKDLNRIYPPPAELIRQSKLHVRTAGQDVLSRAHVLSQMKAKEIPATAEKFESLVQALPKQEELLQISLEPSKPVLRDLAPGNKYLEWLTNIKAEKHTLDGAYTVHVFLGPPQEESTSLWPSAPTHVGTFAPLGQSSDTECGKCQDDQRDHTQVTGQIPLTIALIERYLAGIIDDLSEESVVPYLTENLHWRVVKADGTVLPNRSDVAGLLVFVVSNEVTLPPDDGEFPVYAPTVKVHPSITTNPQGNGRGDGTGLTRADVPAALLS